MKTRVFLVLILLLSLTVSGLAQTDYYRSEDRKADWRADALEKTISIGLGVWRALWSQVTYDTGYSEAYKYSNPDWLFSFDAKLYFYESYFGVGIDAVLMNTTSMDYDAGTRSDPLTGDIESYPAGTATVTQWLVDLDLYFRFPLISSLNLVAGAGLTLNYVNYGDHPDIMDSSSGMGWNLKAGAEFFITSDISTSVFGTMHSFKRGAEIAGASNQNASVILTSLMVMGNYYF